MKRCTHKLQIRDVKHLARLLRTSPAELAGLCNTIASHPERYYFQWPKTSKKGKIRPMVKINGRLRVILDNLKKLLQTIEVPPYVHGGVPKRSTYTNAIPHLGKAMLLRIDLENHFPSVSHRKVYAMFCNEQACTPDVARILTRLTTLNGGLPQGSPTSTIISNLVTLHLSKRLHGFAESRGAECTQYVDDYTFSGHQRLANDRGKILSIVAQEGFKANPTKTIATPAYCEQVTTGIRVNGRCPDIPRSNLKDIHDDLANLRTEALLGKPCEKKVKSIEGKIRYVRRWNPGAAKSLMRQLARIRLAKQKKGAPAKANAPFINHQLTTHQ